jgi:hydrogenase expression/formation protein HypE
LGKLTNKELQKLLGCIRKDERVLIPPMIGYDSGVHLLDGKYVVVSTDPCTGVPEEWFGWLLINYAASDVALFGAKPQFCTINLLGPIGSKPEVFQKVMKQTCSAADELNMAIVRGHTGMYDSLSDLLGVCTVYGTIKPEKLITPKNTKPGDLIYCTKPLGLETITNYSLMHKAKAQKLFGLKQQEKLSKLVFMQSCVKEALQLADSGSVNAMHDATEGGFVAALNELAEASNVGFRVNWQNFVFPNEMLALQKCFELTDEQLLSISSTGTILAAVDPKCRGKVEEIMGKKSLKGYFLGEFTENKNRVLIKEGKENSFPEVANDPYTRILSGK